MGLTDPQGTVTWAVSGTDVAIDQTGLVTTGASACGTFTVTATDSCCGNFDQDVRVTDSGQWVNISVEDGTADGWCTAQDESCDRYASSLTRTCVIDGLQYRGQFKCIHPDCLNATCVPNGPEIPSCWETASHCMTDGTPFVINLFLDEWQCI